jgi:hypothetical protein
MSGIGLNCQQFPNWLGNGKVEMATTRSFIIKPAQTYTMPGVQDERRALIDELSVMYRRYFQREVRHALLASWIEKSPEELRHVRNCWRLIKGEAEVISPQARVRAATPARLFG